MRLTPRSAAFALAAVLAPLSLPAEPVTVSTVPFGGMILEIPAGTSIVSDVFIGSALYQGPVVSVSAQGDILVLNDVPDIDIEKGFYVHILSGEDEGMVSTILTAHSESVTLETPLVVEEGDIVAIRKHQTIGKFFAGAELRGGDSITIYNIDNTSERMTYFEGFGWFDSGFNERDDTFVFPGEGIVVSVSEPITLIASGSVTIHPIKWEFGASTVNILGSINPLGNATLGDLFSATNLSEGDRVTMYANENGIFSSVASYTYFQEFGFFDSSFNSGDETLIGAGNGIVLFSNTSGLVSLPPSYMSE